MWKPLIQSAKRTLLIILGSKRLSFDIFETIMVEVEAILNSRPMTNVADQPENEEPLTLNHFLIQRPYSSLPPRTLETNSQLVSRSGSTCSSWWTTCGGVWLRSTCRHYSRDVNGQTTTSLLWKLEMLCGYSKTWRREESGPLEELWKHPLDETVKYELPK